MTTKACSKAFFQKPFSKAVVQNPPPVAIAPSLAVPKSAVRIRPRVPLFRDSAATESVGSRPRKHRRKTAFEEIPLDLAPAVQSMTWHELQELDLHPQPVTKHMTWLDELDLEEEDNIDTENEEWQFSETFYWVKRYFDHCFEQREARHKLERSSKRRHRYKLFFHPGFQMIGTSAVEHAVEDECPDEAMVIPEFEGEHKWRWSTSHSAAKKWLRLTRTKKGLAEWLRLNRSRRKTKPSCARTPFCESSSTNYQEG